MGAKRIPAEIAAVIQECWPDGVVGEFDTAESYFHDIYEDLERDLRKISGASLLWQSEPPDYEPDSNDDWQSYHVFFLAPHGAEFQFEAETEVTEEPGPDEDPVTTTCPGSGWRGCTVCVSLAAPVAAINLDEFCRFEDGSESPPDMAGEAHDEQTGEPVDLAAQYLDILGGTGFARLQNLQAGIAGVLAKYQLLLADQATLHLAAPELGVDEDVFLEPPVTVRDAFFFRGV